MKSALALTALVALALLVILLRAQKPIDWDRYIKEHRCVITHQERSATPTVPDRVTWECAGGETFVQTKEQR